MSNPNNKEPRIIATCPCGEHFETRQKRIDTGRGKYCSKECKYKFRERPTGLHYNIVSENNGWIKAGQQLGAKTMFKKGDVPHNFSGDNVGYCALHDWVKRRIGKAIKCEHCGKTEGLIEWANKSHKYKRDIDDWIQLCKKCHIKYDRKLGWGVATKRFNLKGRKNKKL